ncbi:TIGR03503 family protein [Shewanella sp. WXL01]|uniref:TIGR03503 family protein n=1 Tax=Shewanella sp. WXL01 TaxID=2709721 RepID=UPI0014384AC1|nr:TIGR03503 family protein [Shewanella sp. WXL01]NKF52599.1 TIGR03503 family protein [Shewanella sp. WXL01]
MASIAKHSFQLLIKTVATALLSLTLVSLGAVAQMQSKIVNASTAQELKNRFRIDSMVSKMTLLIQRQYGSAPVVIVLPDGSKWYSSRHPENVKWVDGVAGDMIYIENPMPGPWQLLGAIVQGSEIKKVSDLQIEVDPFPQPLFRGERIKVHAYLNGDEELITIPGMDYMLEWTARFISDSDSSDKNFATGIVIAGKYQDNGEKLDEAADDGEFTGDVNLDQPTGDYTLQVTARNNIFERQFSSPFTLSERPITAKVIPDEDPQSGSWTLELAITDAVKLEETHFHFDMIGPAGLNIPITLLDMNDKRTLLALPKVTEYGSYRIKGNAVSTTMGGREIFVDLPEMFFNYLEPPAPPPSAEELAAIAAAEEAKAEQEAKDKAVFWIISINVSVLLLGVLALIIWRKKQSLNKALAAAEQELAEEELQAGNTQGMDDIDLSIPDDK